MICVDCSVAAKWSFAEEHSIQARALLRAALESREPIIAPPLLHSEITNVIRQRVRRGDLRLSQARNMLAQFLALPIVLQAPENLYDEALVLSDQLNLPATYDAQYVVLAEHLGVTLWTSDQRLLRALLGRYPFVRAIADYGK